MNDLLGPIRQIAYITPDPVESAIQHSKLYGSGPFLFAEHVPVQNFVYRGKPGDFDHSTVFGQWGEMMVEFCTQHNNAPSHGHDMFPYGSGASGLHHTALIVRDFEEAVALFEKNGFSTASRFRVADSFDVAMMDTRKTNGHMIEIYADIPPIQGAYALSRSIAGDFSRPLIEKISF